MLEITSPGRYKTRTHRVYFWVFTKTELEKSNATLQDVKRLCAKNSPKLGGTWQARLEHGTLFISQRLVKRN